MIAEPQHSNVAQHIHSIGCADAVVVEGEPGGIPHNGILGAAAGVNRDIGAIVAIDGVVAAASPDRVITAAAEDGLVVVTAIDRVVAGTTIKQRAVHGRVIAPLLDQVIAVTARNRGSNIGTIHIRGPVVERVVIRSAVDHPGTVDRVVAGAALGCIIAF